MTYPQLYDAVVAGSKNSCEFLVNMKLVMYTVHALLRTMDAFGGFKKGGYKEMNLLLVKYKKDISTNEDYDNLIAEKCSHFDGAILPVVQRFKQKADEFNTKLAVASMMPYPGLLNPRPSGSQPCFPGALGSHGRPGRIGMVGGGVIVVGGVLLGAAAVIDDGTGAGAADDPILLPAAYRITKLGWEALELGGMSLAR